MFHLAFQVFRPLGIVDVVGLENVQKLSVFFLLGFQEHSAKPPTQVIRIVRNQVIKAFLFLQDIVLKVRLHAHVEEVTEGLEKPGDFFEEADDIILLWHEHDGFCGFDVCGQGFSFGHHAAKYRVALIQLCDLLFEEVVLSLQLLDLHEIATVLIDLVLGVVEAVVQLHVEGIQEGQERSVREAGGIGQLVFHHQQNRYDNKIREVPE